MSKRFLSIAGLLALVPAVSSAEENFYTGFYSGMNLGLSYGQLALKNNTSIKVVVAPFTHLNEKKKQSASNFGLMGDAFVGHRWRLSKEYMIGCEMALTIDRNKVESKPFFTTTISKSQQHLSQKFTFTPSFVFGKIFTPDLLGFIKAGTAWSRFSFVNKNLQTITNQVLTIESQNYQTFGASFSIGAEYALPNNWSATVTASHILYPAKKIKLKERPSIIPLILSDESQSVKVKPSYSSVKLGFVYRY